MNIVSLTRPLAYIAACGVVALGLATAPQAGAVSFSGSLINEDPVVSDDVTDSPWDDPIDLLSAFDIPGTFNAEFDGDDGAGTFTFNFQNSSDSAILLSVVNATINQTDDLFFTTTAGGYAVRTTFGGIIHDTATMVKDSFDLMSLVAPNATISLIFDFGDAVGALSGAGPDIDFNIDASVVPLPAGLVLFLSGLAGIGFLGRYKTKRRVAEIV